jgi:sugar lactone lactonase YvrE
METMMIAVTELSTCARALWSRSLGARSVLLLGLVLPLVAQGAGKPSRVAPAGASRAASASTARGAPPAPTLARFAGDFAGPGNMDGAAAVARFNHPQGLATDAAGNLYVADTFNHAIRKVSPAGDVSTIATTPADSAPTGLAFDATGDLYAVYSSSDDVLKITATGTQSTLPAWTTGSKTGTSFGGEYALAVDRSGNFFVAQPGKHTVRRITPEGVSRILAGMTDRPGKSDGAGAAARFNRPTGVAVDAAGNVYVVDKDNRSVRKITPAGRVSTFAEFGRSGKATVGFREPDSIAVDSAGNVYVSDNMEPVIHKFMPDGAASVIAGRYFGGVAPNQATPSRFAHPTGIATDTVGNVYVADSGLHNITKIMPNGDWQTLAGPPALAETVGGSGSEERLEAPRGIAVDAAGNVYLTDAKSLIRRITPEGVISTLAGAPGSVASKDGIGSAARFANLSESLAIDGAGNLYVVDGHFKIRKITPAGEVGTLAAGNDIPRAAGERFFSVSNVAADKEGNLFVADDSNFIVRKFTPAGVETTVAGQSGQIGTADGQGSEARFNALSGIAVDRVGNVYVSDSRNSTIRKITPTGVVSTLAGAPRNEGSADGLGPDARFKRPQGLAADDAGNLYVADTGNHTVRKITPAGVVSTVVGVAGRVGFSPGALPGSLSGPVALAVGGTSLYIVTYNSVAVVRNLQRTQGQVSNPK